MMSSATTAAAHDDDGNGDVSFYTLGREFDLKLEAHAPFAPGATVQWVDDAGVVTEPADASIHFRGYVDGDPNSWARITRRGNSLAGVISTDGELYFLEPASRFFGDDVPAETLAYRLSDTESEWVPGSCAARELPRSQKRRLELRQRRNARQTLSSVLGDVATTSATAAAANQLHRAQLGMVADFEYFSRHGANSADDIAEIVNAVDGIYQSEIGVTLDLVTTVVYTTVDDPFSGATDPNSILSEFTNWKNNNDDNSSEPLWGTDYAHLVTGRDLNSTVIGIAWVGAVCGGSAAGVDQDFSTATSMMTLLFAHEMGHNFGASHDGSGNSCAAGTYIMSPAISGSLQQKFSTCSKDAINPFVAGASCLDLVNPSPTPTPAPLTLNPISSPITLGTSTTLTGTGFTAGSRIIGFVGTSSGTQSIGPFVPSSFTSTSLVWQAPANMSLGQGFAILAIVNTDQNYVGSEYRQALLYGNASMNRPTILTINGTSLHQPDGALPVVYVGTPIYPGGVVTITGTGFNNVGVNFFTSVGNIGPLFPLSGATATRIQVQIPGNAPLGLGAFEVINNPYSGFVGSQTVFVPIGDPPTITHVSQTGNMIIVDGTGFANGAVVNFFNQQPNGAVSNLGGPALVATVNSSVQLQFQVPQGAMAGPSYLQIVNPPFISFTSSGSDPDGGFTLH